MQALNIMTTDVITVSPDTLVEDIAKLLLERRISGVPVVDANGALLGIVSEGDLIRHSGIRSEEKRSWWLTMMSSSAELATDYVKSHGVRADQVMTRKVVTISETTAMGDIARLLERHHIKRVPVVRAGKLVGIVSRANLLQALATHKEKLTAAVPADDHALREQIVTAVKEQGWLSHGIPNILVNNGAVELWGWVDSSEEREALLLAVQNVPGVDKVIDHLGHVAPYLRDG